MIQSLPDDVPDGTMLVVVLALKTPVSLAVRVASRGIVSGPAFAATVMLAPRVGVKTVFAEVVDHWTSFSCSLETRLPSASLPRTRSVNFEFSTAEMGPG